MSTFDCPTCQRAFGEVGFCPFDGSALVVKATPDQATLVSAAMPIAAHKTDIEPRRTFPLPGGPPEKVDTQELTKACRSAEPPHSSPSAPTKVRALSASEDPQAALAAIRAKPNEYDRLVGQTLDGRYFVERKIGEGGMGVVFSARHAVIERPLAIKVLKREVMRDTATIRRFVQEAQAASRIGHPNIVDVTDFGTTPDGMTYSVMEYVDGNTLGTALRESAPFPAQRAIRIAAQIARALGAAHDKGIVHRDLKPENVFLLDRDGRVDFVKIVDFGIAKVTPVAGANPNEPRLTRAGSVFGTPEYMAPEQAAGRGDTDGRVDIYALGVILYEMLTGRVPHRGDSMVRTLAMQMLDPGTPPTQVRPDLDVSPQLETLVLRALAKKREARFQTMGELLAAFDDLQTQVGTSVTGSPVYALAPLPPGADPRLIPESVPPPVAIPAVALERSKAPTNQPGRRLRDEPEFVTHEKPATFEHVFTEVNELPRARRWPLLLLLAMIAGGAAGAIALVVKSRDSVVGETTRDAAVVAFADALIAPPADAVAFVPVPEDAPDIEIVADAATRVVIRPRRGVDAGTDPGPSVLPTRPGRGVIVQVITKPEGANLYVGHSYTGPSGTNIEKPLGTKLDVQCRLRGYKPGNIQLVFDGKTEYAMCVLTRIKICVDGIKNPIDDCENDPDTIKNLDPNAP